MSKLRIFIEGRELDSLESVTVPIVKQFEELSDPTVICNDYSKTVVVPLSRNNNEVFGYAYNPDKKIVVTDGTIPLVGIYFDPFKKLDCRLCWGDDVFFVGYAKMLKVTNSGYEVTINGELGKIFQELQKITFDKTKYETDTDINKYWIDGSKYVNTIINKELVYKCWNSTQSDYTLREVTDSNYDITNIIGFVANNSYSNDFDYKTVELADGTNKSMSDVLGEAFETNTGYSRDSVIGDGLTPVQMSQFRSYEQIPYIYWNKYWQIFQAKAEELTGYTWDYSDSWFRTSNSNYSGIAAALLQRDSIVSESEKIAPTISMSTGSATIYKSDTSSITLTAQVTDSSISKDNILLVDDGDIKIKLDTTLNLTTQNRGTFAWNNKIFFYNNLTDGVYTNGTALRVQYYYGTNELLDYVYYTATDESTAYYKAKYPNSTLIDKVWTVSGVEPYDYASVPVGNGEVNLTIYKDWGNNPLKIIITPIFVSGEEEGFLRYGDKEGTYTATWVTGQLLLNNTTISSSIVWYKTLFRTGDRFTLNDICNFDFTNILDYCKRFRILIYTDEVNKKLVFTRSYFKDYTITDVTDKVDKSNTFDIETPIFDDKYVLFGYKQNDTLLGSGYKNINTYAYGAKRLDTNYQFNTDTTTLFEKTPETILYSPTYLYWGELLENSLTKKDQLSFWLYNNNFLECRDSSGKTISLSGAYFYPVKKKIDRYWAVTVTDDSDKQKLADTYCNYKYTTGLVTDYWTSPELVQRVAEVYPYIYTTCLFEKPKKNYTAQSDYFDRVDNTVYSSIWKEYINERYSVQNKKVTTYIRITPQQFSSFKFNQLWKIDNQVYVVNKIYDYDITSDKPTKVDLITVQNISAYY